MKDTQKNSVMKFLYLRFGFSILMMIFLILGILGVKIAIPIALILLGIVCIVTSIPMWKSNNIKSTVINILCGLLVIFCAIKSLL
ncbi:MAG: hypothetical protein ACI4WH_02085 [Oscillospiraceae bacterium]